MKKGILAILVLIFFPFVHTVHATDAPSVTIQSVWPLGGVTPGQTVTFLAVASGFTDPKYEVNTGSIDIIGNFSWTPTISDIGTKTITVTVSDTYSHSASASVNVQVVNNIVSISSLSPGTTVAILKPVSFTITAPGFKSPLYFTVTDAYAGTTVTNANITSSGVFTWTPVTNEQGAHRITVGVSDLYGHEATITQPITVIAPRVNIRALSPDVNVAAGTKVTFTAVSADMTNPTFSVSDTFLLGTSTVTSAAMNTTGAFAWTPATSDAGTHFLTINASDTLGNTASTTQVIAVAAPQWPLQTITQNTPSQPASTTAQNVATTTSAQSRYIFSTLLTFGSKGAAVTELQKRLASDKLYTGPITGYYGALTAAAVKKFQTAHGIAAVGYVGPATRSALNRL